jgi:hypothetical protein
MQNYETNGRRKRNRLFGWILPIFVAILLFATNPSDVQFKQFIKDDLIAQGRSDSPLAGTIMQLLAGPATYLSSSKRTNYYVCSVYDINIMGDPRTYLGVLNHFYKLK